MKNNYLLIMTSETLKYKDMDLYELIGEFEWIKDYIYFYNDNGFMTVTSQPGEITKNIKIYKSEWHARMRDETDAKTSELFSRRQRAYIRGYMDEKMADYIVKDLQNDENIFARSTNHNGVINEEIKLGSVIFIADKAVAYEMYEYETDEATKYIPHFGGSFNLKYPLHRPYTGTSTGGNIVEFDIIDRRFNDNSELWSKLKNSITRYKDSHG